MKSKSKYYCQMCKVGTDSETYFRTHLLTRGHCMQMKAYERNPSDYAEFLSSKFARQFLEILVNDFGLVAADVCDIYNVYVKDKHHVRLSCTKWVTISDFLEWLSITFRDKCAVVVDANSQKTTIEVVDADFIKEYIFINSRRVRPVKSLAKARASSSTSKHHVSTNKRKFSDLNVDKVVGNNNTVKQQMAILPNTSQLRSMIVIDDPFNLNALIQESFLKQKKNKPESSSCKIIKRRKSVSVNHLQASMCSSDSDDE